MNTVFGKFLTQGAKHSIAALFFIYVVISIVLLLLTISLFVTPGIKDMVERIESVSRDYEITTVKSNIERFISSRAQILQDIAQSPVIVNSAMQSSSNNVYLKDFMEDLLLFGKKEEFYLANILGQLVYKANSDDERHINPEEAWFIDLLDNKKNFTFEVIEENDEFLFQIAVPIKFKHLAEGVFFANVKIDPAIITGIDFTQKSRALLLKSRDGKVLKTDLEHIVAPLELKRNLPEIESELSYIFDQNLLEREQQQLLSGITIRLVAVTVVSFLLLTVIGYKIILAPYRNLRLSEEKLRVVNENLEVLKNDAVTVSDRMQAILESAAEAIITINDQGAIRSFNRAAEVMFDYKETDILGENVKILMPSPYREEHDKYLTSYMKTRKKNMIGEKKEEIAIRKNGEIFPIDLSVSQVRADGELLFTGLISDITERKKAEENLAQANTELEEFAYRTSHDLRSPILSCISLLDMTEQSIRESDQDNAIFTLSYAQISLKKLETLIRDILALTETKNKEEEEQEIDFPIMVHDALDKLAHMDGFKDIDIHKDFQFDQKLFTKKLRLCMILENLISNTIKYRDPEKKYSYAKISTREENDHFVLEVKDNGLGIPKDNQDKLFTMFKRFHPKVAFGSGLGLYLMKKSADVLNGEISFNDHGEGSLFRLSIPFYRKVF